VTKYICNLESKFLNEVIYKATSLFKCFI